MIQLSKCGAIKNKKSHSSNNIVVIVALVMIIADDAVPMRGRAIKMMYTYVQQCNST